MNSAESDVMVVAGILTLFYRIVPTVVGEGTAGTATSNYVAQDSDGARWFVKAYPAGTDLDAERQALELGEFARLGRIPVPVVHKTLDGDLIAAAGGMAVSVAAYIEDTETAAGGLSGDRWATVGETVGRLPPGHRSPAWELGRIVLDPRTVLAQPQWPTGLAEAVTAYRAANPALPAEELLAVPRLAAGYLACSVYPLSEAVDDPAAVTPELEAYGRNRQAAMAELCERLPEAEEVLHDFLH